MKHLELFFLLTAIAVALVAALYGSAYVLASIGARGDVGGAQLLASASRGPSLGEADSRVQIAFWSKRAGERPRAYLDLTLLGQAYVRRARETSDVAYYTRAERALRQALRVNADYVPAVASLASVLFAQHEFAEALSLAQPVAGTAEGMQALATVGDARFALGQYRRAESAYRRLLAWSPSAAGYSRLAFLADVRGQTDRALALMERAALLARDSGDGGESLAWYALQMGELAFRAGRIELAESHYRTALELFGDYPVALGGLARTRAAQGDPRAAIRLYRMSVAIVPSPDALAALGDLYAAEGKTRNAREQYSTIALVAKLARSKRQLYDRQLALYYADRGIRLSEARRLALAELRARKDVFGFDAAAWALARSGRCAEALPLTRRALRLGTRDALLYFHRGYAEGCAGNRGAMRRWYRRALALNPGFSVRWAPVAEAVLERS